MRKLKVVLGKIIYAVFAVWLPVSYTPILGVYAKWLRGLCGKLILQRCGKHVNIERGAAFSSRVTLGDGSGIGVRASISGAVEIGDYVMMGPDCVIYSRNHAFDRTDIPMMQQGYQPEKPVVIGNDVWIGGHVILLPGVHIGDGAVIGAGAVVAKSIPPYAVAVGNPARVVKYRDGDKNAKEEHSVCH